MKSFINNSEAAFEICVETKFYQNLPGGLASIYGYDIEIKCHLLSKNWTQLRFQRNPKPIWVVVFSSMVLTQDFPTNFHITSEFFMYKSWSP